MFSKLSDAINAFRKRNSSEIFVEREKIEVYVKATSDYLEINDKSVSFDASILNVDGDVVSDTGEIINVFAMNGMANLVKDHVSVGDTLKVVGELQKTESTQSEQVEFQQYIFAKSIYKCKVQ